MSQTMIASVGWSAAADATTAGHEAAAHALERCRHVRAALAIVLGSSWFDQGPLLAGVRSVLRSAPIVGGSTEGEIVPEGPVTHHCVVLLLASEGISASVGLGEAVDRVPREAGQQAAYTAMRDFHGSPRMGFLLFGGGLTSTSAEVLRGIQEVVGTGALIIGGMTGDALRLTRTSQYANDHVATQAVAGALLGGLGKIGIGIEHGFAPISGLRRITRARANVLHALDGQPAASVYEEYFGPEHTRHIQREGLTRQVVAYPLGIHLESSDRWLLRNVLAVGEDGSVTCTGEIVEGAWLQLMIGNRDLVLNAASHAAQQAIRSLDRIACVLVFDSALRKTLLGYQHAAAEITRIREIIGPSTPLAGCYTYGEQAPLGAGPGDELSATQTASILVVAIGT